MTQHRLLWPLCFALLLTLFISGCKSENGFTNGAPQNLTLERIAIHPNPTATKGQSDLTLAAGNRQPFEAIGYYSNGTSKVLTDTVSWHSSNSDVATFAPSGVLHAQIAGSTDVSATLGNITSHTLSISVTRAVVTTIQVTPALHTMAKGQTESLTAMAIYSDRTSVDVTRDVQWTSQDDRVVDINVIGGMTAKGKGATTITASQGDIQSNTVNITVTDAVLTSIQVTPAVDSLAKGQTEQLTATAYYSDGHSSNVTTRVTWSLGNNVISVTPSGLLTGVTKGNTSFFASLDSIKSNTLPISVTDAVIEAIQVTPSVDSVAKGQTEQLTAMARYSDGTPSDVTQRVSWVPADTDTATVNPNGLLTGVKQGSTTIVASLDGIDSNTASVTVTDAVIESIQVTPSVGSVAKGQTEQLTAMARYSDGTPSDVTQRVSWVPADTDTATVNPNGLLTGVKQGSTTIVATLDRVDSNTASVTVTDAVIESIQVTPSTGSVAKGQTEQLTAMARYSDGTPSDVTQRVSWAPTDTDTATVNPNGLLTGVKQGSTTIVASLDGIDSNTASVTVTDAVIEAIQVTPSAGSVAKGQTEQLTAMARYSDGTPSDVTQRVSWAPADTDTATVNPNGLLTGVKQGSTTIVASLDGIDSNTASVTVTDAVIETIQVTPSAGSVAKGQTEQLTAMARYSDGTPSDVTQRVSWTPADTSIATVDSNGLLTGVKKGSTTIVATLDGIDSNIASVTVTDAVVERLQVTPSPVTVAKGQSQSMLATAYYSDGDSSDVTNSVTWVPTDANIATVTPTGLLTGVKVDNTTLVARFNGIDSNVVSVSVTDAILTSINVTPNPTISMAKGQTESLMAMGTYSDSSTLDITNNVTWSSTDTNVATVSPTGTLSAVTLGNSTVTAELNGLDSNNVFVSVTDAIVTAVAVTTDDDSSSPVTLAKGLTVQLKATVTYSDNSTSVVTNTATWTPENSGKATVSPTGLLSGVDPGNTSITATYDGVDSNALPVSITDAVITAIALAPSQSVPKGQSIQLNAVATMSDNDTQDVTNSVTWSSASTSTATVSPSGVLSGVETGNTTVTAKLDDITSNTLNVTVTAPPIAVCGNVQGFPINYSPTGGIDNTDKTNAAGNCLKLRSTVHNSETKWFTSSPSLVLMQTLGYTSSSNPQNFGRSYAGTINENGTNGPIGTFVLFRQDGTGVPYPPTESGGLTGQYGRWCQDLAEREFAGKTNWRRATYDEMGALRSSSGSGVNPLYNTYGWPTGKASWSSNVDSFVSKIFSYNLIGGTITTLDPWQPLFASCVSGE